MKKIAGVVAAAFLCLAGSLVYAAGGGASVFASGGDQSVSDNVLRLARYASPEELYYTVKFHFSGGTVHAKVDISNKDYKSIRNAGGYVEVRLYAGKDRGHIKRLEHRTYHMRDDVSDYTFPSNEVCDEHGSYRRYVKVWASARERDGSPMHSFKSSNEGKQMTVTCNSGSWYDYFFGW